MLSMLYSTLTKKAHRPSKSRVLLLKERDKYEHKNERSQTNVHSTWSDGNANSSLCI
ncbi:hypothetical protein ACI8B_210145 [Acinetobacter proteolyticus]|uniref:Uncharacterized protein n=1 Tax=Acinetobacter proteolyticus TaxID=1776741 RepID=A0A653K3E9_9GAMM|nr:hypothetical protein ACI8B_210145 [Acinetobacter proteolyticus]